jgi:hypothetical protein
MQEIWDQPHHVAFEYASAQEQLGCRIAPSYDGQGRRYHEYAGREYVTAEPRPVNGGADERALRGIRPCDVGDTLYPAWPRS